MRPAESEGSAGGVSGIAPTASSAAREVVTAAPRAVPTRVSPIPASASRTAWWSVVGARTTSALSAKVVMPIAVSSGAASVKRSAASMADASRVGVQIGLGHRVGDVERDHHAAAPLLGRGLHRGAGHGDDAGGHRQQGHDRGGRAQGACAAARADGHHGRVGPAGAGTAARPRPGDEAHGEGDEQHEGPEPSGGLEAHDRRGPSRQAAAPASASSRAPSPAAQAVTSPLTRSVPMKVPRRS